MTDPSQSKKKRKITYAASPQGVEKAEKALKRLGFESKINFAKSNLLSRSTVTKFFQCQPIQFDSLRRICKALTLDWQEIVQMREEEPSKRLEVNEPSTSDTNEGMVQVQTPYRKVTVLDKHSQVIKAVIILEGDFNSINNNLSVSLQAILREFLGDTIKITDIEEGSIRLIIEGSPEDIGQLISKFNSREFTEVNGFPIQDVQILSESSDEDESNELNDKWRLVQEIVTQVVDGRNLRGADLSDADLSSANLRDANLSNADLSGANLSDADLSGANLRGADLSDADLHGVNPLFTTFRAARLEQHVLSSAILINVNLISANLPRANLSNVNLLGADLSDANLSDANLSDADLLVADLSGANLSGANLSGANLRGANLRGANLRGANLRGANLNRAVVEKAQFGANLGLTEEMKLDLKQRGAIFEDFPGDRSKPQSDR